MLTEHQINAVWRNKLAAETRCLYFGDLSTKYARQKQWITGLSFFLSSGAAATLVAKSPVAVPIALSVTTAIMTAYSIAVSLDQKVERLAKLSSSWREIAVAYDHLWNHAYEDDAEKDFNRIVDMEVAPSELAAMDGPTDERRLDHWQQRVFRLYHLTDQNA